MVDCHLRRLLAPRTYAIAGAHHECPFPVRHTRSFPVIAALPVPGHLLVKVAAVDATTDRNDCHNPGAPVPAILRLEQFVGPDQTALRALHACKCNACASISSMTNAAASALAAKRWANKTPKDKSDHAKKMAAARWKKGGRPKGRKTKKGTT